MTGFRALMSLQWLPPLSFIASIKRFDILTETSLQYLDDNPGRLHSQLLLCFDAL